MGPCLRVRGLLHCFHQISIAPQGLAGPLNVETWHLLHSVNVYQELASCISASQLPACLLPARFTSPLSQLGSKSTPQHRGAANRYTRCILFLPSMLQLGGRFFWEAQREQASGSSFLLTSEQAPKSPGFFSKNMETTTAAPQPITPLQC